MTITPADRVERIRALTYLLKVLRTNYRHAIKAMDSATDPTAFNEALRLARDIDVQITKYHNELFDLTEA